MYAVHLKWFVVKFILLYFHKGATLLCKCIIKIDLTVANIIKIKIKDNHSLDVIYFIFICFFFLD